MTVLQTEEDLSVSILNKAQNRGDARGLAVAYQILSCVKQTDAVICAVHITPGQRENPKRELKGKHLI